MTDISRIPAGAEADPFAAPGTFAAPASGVPAGAVPAGAAAVAPPPPPPPAEVPQLTYAHKVGSMVETAEGVAVVLSNAPVHRVINGQAYVIPGYKLGYFTGVTDLEQTAEDLGITSTS